MNHYISRPKATGTLRLLLPLLFLGLLVGPLQLSAQCRNWSAQAMLTTGMGCAPNPSVTVFLSGPDAANLTNVQYGIPIAYTGMSTFSTPLSSSPTFSNLQPGSYKISAVGMCNGVFVGRNTNISVPAGYTAPSLHASARRASLSCGATGTVGASVNWGVPPYRFTVTAHPPGYSGPASSTGPAGFITLVNAPPGGYSFAVTDSCGSSASASTTVGSVNVQSIPLINRLPAAVTCDSLLVTFPYIDGSVAQWATYSSDTTIRITAEIAGVTGVSPLMKLGSNYWRCKLPAGQTLKDCYGKQINFTLYLACGTPVVRSQIIPSPVINTTTLPRCNNDFDIQISAIGMVCYPASFTLRNTVTNQSYGPYTAATSASAAMGTGLPVGSYTVSMTTADGYTTSRSLTVAPTSANPYSVSVIPGNNGINGFAAGFLFSTRGAPSGLRTVELFSGPSGYFYRGQWYGTQPLRVVMNGSPTSTTLVYPPGTYVWKITDDCGTYYLQVQVTAADIYRYVIDSVSQMRTCAGLEIRPWVRAWRNGVLQSDAAFTVPGATSTPMTSGSQVLLRSPGTYMIFATTSGQQPMQLGYYSTPGGGSVIGYPNMYNTTAEINYTEWPLSANMDAMQGFICPGAAPGTARIDIVGQDGFPFRGPSGGYYHYALAARGKGATGPYIATNTTGIFTGFNGVVNAYYDVKITDSCGDTAIRTIRILDLEKAGIISSSEYVVCRADSLRMSALYLPNATYTWSGPNGFSASVREPLISPLLPAHSGYYRLVVNTSLCSRPVHDTSVLAVNDIPHKPLFSYSCDPKPTTLTVTNPVPGHQYLWQFGQIDYSTTPPAYYYWSPIPGSAPPLSTALYVAGSVAPVTVDTLTGCQTKGDTLVFNTIPFMNQKLEVTANRLKICTGDTTTLLIKNGVSPGALIQWYRNGIPLAGATQYLLSVSQGGDYHVILDGGRCVQDTSAVVRVEVLSPPQAMLTASDTVICSGDTALLSTPYRPDYSYSWTQDGTSVPGAFDSSLRVTEAGVYQVTVSNGGCIAQSRGLTITVVPVPIVDISPSGDQTLCPGKTLALHLAPPVPASASFAWTHDGGTIAGADSASLQVSGAGSYTVIVTTPVCGAVESAPVRVTLLSTSLGLPADTTICNDDPFLIPLNVNSGFKNVLWSTGATGLTMDITSTGLYWARAEHECGVFSDTFRVYSYRDYEPAWPADTTICNPANAALLRVPSILRDIRWSSGETGPAMVVREPGRYWMEGKSPCATVRDTIDVGFCAPRILDLGLPDDTLCVGDCFSPQVLVGNFPRDFFWSVPGATPETGTSMQPGRFCFSSPGRYEVFLRAGNAGGADSATAFVDVAAKPLPRFRDTALTAPYRSKVILPACADAAHADWYRNDSLICSGCPTVTLDANYYFNTYKCVLRNASCPDSCSYILRVVDIPHEIWLPDAFTPNGDGRNDRFGIITDNPNVRVINLEVFNRWGQRVFVGNMNNDGWDGSFGGRGAEMGTYHWQLRYRVLDRPDVVHYLKGDILLIR